MQQHTSDFVPIDDASINRALDLNNRHAAELSFQTLDEFRQLVAKATYCQVVRGRAGLPHRV